MTGGGFGGAVVALVDRSQSEAFLDAVSSGYTQRTHREGTCFLTDAADGARLLT
jgi:galactokinase